VLVFNSTIDIWISRNNRSVGGIAAGANGNSIIRDATINGIKISFTGSDNIAANRLEPDIGIAVGHLNTSSMINFSQAGSQLERGSLIVIRYGLFNLLTHDQARNVGRGTNGIYGRSSGPVTVS